MDPIYRLALCLMLAWTWVFAADAFADAGSEAAVLHAEAIVAEIDGKSTEALELLRSALQADPNSREVAFELARIAMDLPEHKRPTDLEVFLALTPENEQEQLLRAYALADRGDFFAAAAAIETGLPSSDELLEVRSLLAAKDSTADQQVSAEVFIGAQYDSNVTLLPDVASGPDGARMMFSGRVGVVPFASVPRWELLLNADFTRHLNDRVNTAIYDAASASVSTTYSHVVGSIEIYGELGGTVVYTDSFGAHFMNDVSGTVELRLLEDLTPGAYLTGGYRDYVVGNLDGTDSDRDGPVVQAGVLLEWFEDNLAVAARAGFYMEQSQGSALRQRGVDASAFVQWRPGPLSVLAGLTFEWRRFVQPILGIARRVDTRPTPQIEIAYDILKNLAVRGSYAYTRNSSLVLFDYSRHVVTFGIDGRY